MGSSPRSPRGKQGMQRHRRRRSKSPRRAKSPARPLDIKNYYNNNNNPKDSGWQSVGKRSTLQPQQQQQQQQQPKPKEGDKSKLLSPPQNVAIDIGALKRAEQSDANNSSGNASSSGSSISQLFPDYTSSNQPAHDLLSLRVRNIKGIKDLLLNFEDAAPMILFGSFLLSPVMHMMICYFLHL